jgi:plastocyanin
MRARPALAALLIAAATLITAAGPATALDEEEIEIESSGDMSNWGFDPSTLTVPAGTKVTWRNTGRQTHSITSRDHLFDSRLLDEDDEWSYTFDDPGTYRYFCVPHPWMKGTVVVTDADGTSSR